MKLLPVWPFLPNVSGFGADSEEPSSTLRAFGHFELQELLI